MNKIPEKKLNKIEKILIIQQKPFGDILLNTGYFPTLRKKFPDAQIDYLIEEPYKTLLEDNPYIDNLIFMKKIQKGYVLPYFFEKLRIMKLVRSNKYDVVIDQIRGTTSAQITFASGAKYRLGWKLKRWNWVYNYSVERKNIRYYSRLKFDLLHPLGISEEPHNIFYKVKKKSNAKITTWLEKINLLDKPFIIFSPGSPAIYKQWSLDYYATLADRIQNNHDFRIILLWGPGEKKDVDYIKKNMETEPIIALPTSFNEAAALLQKSTMFIGNDGGINHVAISQKTPSIVIFGARFDPKKWQAWHKPEHVYLKKYDCKSHKGPIVCISPDEVYDKFEELLIQMNLKD